MSLAEARADLVEALGDIEANVYAFPPAVVIPPAVVLLPGDDYVEVARIGATTLVRQRFRITAAIAPLDNEAALDQIEQLITDILTELPATVGFETGFSSPRMSQIGPSDLLTSDMTITVMTDITTPAPPPPPEPEPEPQPEPEPDPE